MLPHSTVSGIHFVASVAAACNFPVVVGTVVTGAVDLVPSGMRYAPDVVVVIAAVVVVGFVAAAFVGAIVTWDAIVSGAVVSVAARCIVHYAAVLSMPLACLIQIGLSPFASSLSIPVLLPSHLVGSCAAPSYKHPRTCVLRLFSLSGSGAVVAVAARCVVP